MNRFERPRCDRIVGYQRDYLDKPLLRNERLQPDTKLNIDQVSYELAQAMLTIERLIDYVEDLEQRISALESR
jgi:hypothetical protein